MSAIKISQEEGQTLIENYVKAPKIKFIKYELVSISEVAEGYMGEHYNLRVTYLQNGKASTAEFFIKHTPTKNKYQAEIASKSNVYAREIFLYDVLFKKFQIYGFDTSFASESFYCIPNKAIIMENMKNKGYKVVDRHVHFNEEQLKCALRALAKYHAAGFAYEKIKSLQLGRNYKLTDEYSEFLEESFFTHYLPDARNTGAQEYWQGCKKTTHHLVNQLPLDEAAKNKLNTYLSNYKLGKIFADETKYAKTLGHGDLWSNNILFKMEADKAVSCCLVDYQILRYFYPSFDVMILIYSNTDKQFRTEYFHGLCDYYYDALNEIYRNYGFDLNDVMPKVEFQETFDLFKIDMLLQVASVSAITCIPKEVLNEKAQNDEDFKEAFFDNYKISVKAFQTDETYRKVLTELLIEIYDIFQAKNI